MLHVRFSFLNQARFLEPTNFVVPGIFLYSLFYTYNKSKDLSPPTIYFAPSKP